jgi:sterol desaturase/sphingolipid hydroxylase (fatty acid hydroxylase superfamily)
MLADIYDAFFGPGVRLSPPYLLAFVVMALAIFVVRERSFRPRQFLAWLFPAAIWRHPSLRVDVQLYVLNRMLSLSGALGAVTVQTVVAVAVAVGLGRLTGTPMAAGAWSGWSGVVVTVAILIASDFVVYWVHRAHHELPVLWPFHAVHHSAEVMTPITVYRKHPVYDLIEAQVRALVMGAVIGALLVAVTDRIDVITLGGTHAAYFLFHLLGSNFRHSHVWISYGPVLEHLLISPAQHQIHHSRAVRHHNRNYGEVLAIWDWMFGTLYVPRGREEFEIGLAESDGTPIPQPHPTFARALMQPLRDSRAALRRRRAVASRP